MYEIARETALFLAGHEALILNELLNQSFLERTEGVFELSAAFFEKRQLLALGSRCDSEKVVPYGLNDPSKDVTVYTSTSLRNFLVRSAEMAAFNRVIAHLVECALKAKFEISTTLRKCWKKLSRPWIHRFIHKLRSSFGHFTIYSRNQNAILASAILFSTGLTLTRAPNRWYYLIAESPYISNRTSREVWQILRTQIDGSMPQSLKLTSYFESEEKW